MEYYLIAKYITTIYPKKSNKINMNGFAICRYKCISDEVTPDGNSIKDNYFTATGYGLPDAPINYHLNGKWTDGKYGLQFQVESFTECVEKTKESILGFLSSGLISGIGTATAERIYEAFGNDSFDVIKDNPERLKEIKGITAKKLQKIKNSFDKYFSVSEVVGYLSSIGISASKAIKICNAYKDRDALKMIKEHPYSLCEINGVGFDLANKIALAQNVSSDDPERCMAIMRYVLRVNELSGNLYMDAGTWQTESLKLINSPNVSINDVHKFGQILIKEQKVKYVSITQNGVPLKVIYRNVAAEAETSVAMALKRILAQPLCLNYDISDEIIAFEHDKGFKLGTEQKLAIERSLSNKVSIITGGPGSGKTTIIRAIYDIYKKKHPSASILLCAPTGRASRKMTESVGVVAQTIHSVLKIHNINEDDMDTVDEEAATKTKINANLIIIDECSMLDIYLTNSLFQSIDDNTQIVLIGDVDQLPSVGPGAVLDELISCQCVPLSRLRKIYRQKNDSQVFLNALKVKEGNFDLVYDKSFNFIEVSSFEEAAKKMKEIYAEEVGMNGLDSVVMLSPYRKSTESGVNALNDSLHDQINPPTPYKAEVICSGKTFRLGDRVMQTQNTANASNGDVGYITKIDADHSKLYVNFDGKNDVSYNLKSDDIDHLELAYATTVHKSQGSEYDVVIVNLMNQHKNMLTRNLFYTAITRAKQKVIIVGQKSAIDTAISVDLKTTYKRNTLLGFKIITLLKRAA